MNAPALATPDEREPAKADTQELAANDQQMEAVPEFTEPELATPAQVVKVEIVEDESKEISPTAEKIFTAGLYLLAVFFTVAVSVLGYEQYTGKTVSYVHVLEVLAHYANDLLLIIAELIGK